MGNKVSKYKIGLIVTPVQGHVVVAKVDDDLRIATGIQTGDEILEVDGRPPFDYLPAILQYQSLNSPATEAHFIFKLFDRDFYMTSLLPTHTTVHLRLQASGQKPYDRDIHWNLIKGGDLTLAGSMRSNAYRDPMTFKGGAALSIAQMGAFEPFFMSQQVRDRFKTQAISADQEHLKKYGLDSNNKARVYAASYRFAGKNILLLRIGAYFQHDVDDVSYLNALKATLDTWESNTDVLVFDQTHNPGGHTCLETFRLFTKNRSAGVVESLHADQLWVTTLNEFPRLLAEYLPTLKNTDVFKTNYAMMAAEVERAIGHGDHMTPPLPFMTGEPSISPADYVWQKPMLVLADELSGSCADVFPMLIKGNHIARIFGQTTAGAGGSYEDFEPHVVLSNSKTEISFTRGLFTLFKAAGNYEQNDFVENNGIVPDYPYQVSIDDFKAGFVDYVQAMSEHALEQISQ